jgi:Predicted acetyltransferase, GNAT superfamily
VLYRAVEDEARRQGASAVTCEVNLEPPNPGSLAFHHREGFRDLDTQATKGGAVVVQLMAKEIR